MEFDLLTFNDKEDINIYFDKIWDYQYNLEENTLSISDGTFLSKLPSTLPLYQEKWQVSSSEV